MIWATELAFQILSEDFATGIFESHITPGRSKMSPEFSIIFTKIRNLI